uniref:Uncharacterized protein n=1 Tax=Glossina palpalis gambiensis TaxID=67801 RepID=A0A1B0C4Z5_9MUSC
MPYVNFGTPGTGKTVTLVGSVLQIFKLIPSARLLIGTHSNSSANLITMRLIESDVLKMGESSSRVCHALSFIQNEKRINVAISRPQQPLPTPTPFGFSLAHDYEVLRR